MRKEDQGLLHSCANQYNPHSMVFRSEVTRTILGVQKDLDMHTSPQPTPTFHLHLYNRTPGEENAQDQGVLSRKHDSPGTSRPSRNLSRATTLRSVQVSSWNHAEIYNFSVCVCVCGVDHEAQAVKCMQHWETVSGVHT